MKRIIFSLMASILLFASCAEKDSETDRQWEERVLGAYMRTHYGDLLQDTLRQQASGLYMINLKKGTGDIPNDSCLVEFNTTIRTFQDMLASTTYEHTARLENVYSSTTHYAPAYTYYRWSIVPGIKEALGKMRAGDSTRLIIPSWLAYGTVGTTGISGNTTMVCDIKLEKVVPISQAKAYEQQQIADYMANHPGFVQLDTFENVYWRTVVPSDTTNYIAEAGDNFSYRYAAFFLDGHMFETTIDSLATSHGIAVTNDGLPTAAKVGSSGLVKGLEKVMLYMSRKQTVEVLFTSDYAYGTYGNYTSSTSSSTSSGNDINPYTPLGFVFQMTYLNKATTSE